jgi:hypothetical protein
MHLPTFVSLVALGTLSVARLDRLHSSNHRQVARVAQHDKTAALSGTATFAANGSLNKRDFLADIALVMKLAIVPPGGVETSSDAATLQQEAQDTVAEEKAAAVKLAQEEADKAAAVAAKKQAEQEA